MVRVRVRVRVRIRVRVRVRVMVRLWLGLDPVHMSHKLLMVMDKERKPSSTQDALAILSVNKPWNVAVTALLQSSI